MHKQSHTVVRLATHEENVHFGQGEEAMALGNADKKPTTLPAWFELNF